MPFASADVKTTASGMNKNRPRNNTATLMSAQRTSAPSVVAWVALAGTADPRFRNVNVVAISLCSNYASLSTAAGALDPFLICLPLQACKRLIANNITNDATSMTTAIAVAPV